MLTLLFHPYSFRCLRGFSLIELMIVVAIIGILAVIAIPSYQTYTHKAKFTEVVQAAAPFKLAVESCMHEMGSLSACINMGDGSGQNGIPPAVNNANNTNSYVKSVSVVTKGDNHVAVVCASQHIGKSNESFTYILDGSVQDDGTIMWIKDPQSTCSAAGLC